MRCYALSLFLRSSGHGLKTLHDMSARRGIIYNETGTICTVYNGVLGSSWARAQESSSWPRFSRVLSLLLFRFPRRSGIQEHLLCGKSHANLVDFS